METVLLAPASHSSLLSLPPIIIYLIRDYFILARDKNLHFLFLLIGSQQCWMDWIWIWTRLILLPSRFSRVFSEKLTIVRIRCRLKVTCLEYSRQFIFLMSAYQKYVFSGFLLGIFNFHLLKVTHDISIKVHSHPRSDSIIPIFELVVPRKGMTGWEKGLRVQWGVSRDFMLQLWQWQIVGTEPGRTGAGP